MKTKGNGFLIFHIVALVAAVLYIVYMVNMEHSNSKPKFTCDTVPNCIVNRGCDLARRALDDRIERLTFVTLHDEKHETGRSRGA